MTKQQYEQAKDAGRRARQAGKGRYDGPLYGSDPASLKLRDAWRDGWDEVEEQRRRAA